MASHWIAEADREPVVLLPQPPECYHTQLPSLFYFLNYLAGCDAAHVITALGRQGQVIEFETSQGYVVRSCLRNNRGKEMAKL